MRSHFSALLVLGAGLLAAPPAPAAQESAADGEGEQDIEIIIESEDLSQRILVAPFAATTRDSTGLAASLYEFLFGELMATGQHVGAGGESFQSGVHGLWTGHSVVCMRSGRG